MPNAHKSGEKRKTSASFINSGRATRSVVCGTGISGNCSRIKLHVPFMCLSVSGDSSTSNFFSLSFNFNSGTQYDTGLGGESSISTRSKWIGITNCIHLSRSKQDSEKYF